MDAFAFFCANYLYLVQLLVAAVFFLRQKRSRKLEMVAFGLVFIPLAVLAAEGTGLVYNDPRPFVTGHFTPLIPHSPDNGFPSDHSLLTSSVATLVLYFSWPVGLLLWVMAILVGASRVYAGIHHAIDVLGAFAFAIVLSPLGYLSATRWLGPRLKRRLGTRD